MGLALALMIEPLDTTVNPQFKNAKYRPGQISVLYPSSTNRIAISWDDSEQYHEPLSLSFLREVKRRT